MSGVNTSCWTDAAWSGGVMSRIGRKEAGIAILALSKMTTTTILKVFISLKKQTVPQYLIPLYI